MKHVQVRLEDAEFELLEKGMKRRHIDKLQDAVREAILEWASVEPDKAGPWGSLSAAERRYMLAVLRYVREDRQGLLMSLLDELAKSVDKKHAPDPNRLSELDATGWPKDVARDGADLVRILESLLKTPDREQHVRTMMIGILRAIGGSVR